MKMTEQLWKRQLLPLKSYSALDKLMRKMLKMTQRDIAKTCVVKKSDIGKPNTRSGIEHIKEGGKYDHTQKVRRKLDTPLS